MSTTTYCFRLAVGACLLWIVSGQYHAQYRNSNDQQYHLSQQQQQQQQQQQSQIKHQPVRVFAPNPITPRPLILSHKQQLTHDGGFNYAFAADNGLQQGESIAPDGTRAGTYSYVDPSGKQITVKYTAGKEGFRILQGDHIPRQPPTALPSAEESPEQEQQQHVPQYTAPASNAGPQTFYNRPAIVHQPALTTAPLPRYLAYKNQSPEANTIQPEPEYNDEPGSPHSFGNGYLFEFGG